MRNQSVREGASGKGNNVVCTELCKCDGEGDNCTNIKPPIIHASSVISPLQKLIHVQVI